MHSWSASRGLSGGSSFWVWETRHFVFIFFLLFYSTSSAYPPYAQNFTEIRGLERLSNVATNFQNHVLEKLQLSAAIFWKITKYFIIKQLISQCLSLVSFILGDYELKNFYFGGGVGPRKFPNFLSQPLKLPNVLWITFIQKITKTIDIIFYIKINYANTIYRTRREPYHAIIKFRKKTETNWKVEKSI